MREIRVAEATEGFGLKPDSLAQSTEQGVRTL